MYKLVTPCGIRRFEKMWLQTRETLSAIELGGLQGRAKGFTKTDKGFTGNGGGGLRSRGL